MFYSSKPKSKTSLDSLIAQFQGNETLDARQASINPKPTTFGSFAPEDQIVGAQDFTTKR